MPNFNPNYTAEQYGHLLINLLPPGPAFPRVPNTSTWKLMSGLAIELNRIDGQLNALVKEAFPQLTTTLIENWEIEMGLPGFFTLPATVEDRQAMIEFIMIWILNLHMARGLSNNFWEQLAAHPFIDYHLTALNLFNRLAVGPEQRAHLVGDATLGSDTITNIGDTSTCNVGDYCVIDQGFPLVENRVYAKTANSIRVDIPATVDAAGTTIRLFNEFPACCGDPVGENFMNVFEAAVTLPNSSPTYTPHYCTTTAGSNIVTTVDSAMNSVVGYYMIFERGFYRSYQKIIAKTADTLTVENPADYSSVYNVEAKMKTKGGDLLENVFNWFKPAHTKIIFKYS